MRLFAALRPPAEQCASLSSYLDALPGEHPRWVEPSRWHVTVAFYGSVPDATVEELASRLARTTARTPGFPLALAGGGRFGSSVLWVGVAGDRPALTRLAERCTAAARRSGLPMPDQPFHPHLTLARSRDGSDLRPWVGPLAEYAGPPWRVEQLSLVRSTPGPSPRYDDVAAWPLAGG